jgi:hypothetical protein
MAHSERAGVWLVFLLPQKTTSREFTLLIPCLKLAIAPLFGAEYSMFLPEVKGYLSVAGSCLSEKSFASSADPGV